jgi:hypothetical protein
VDLTDLIFKAGWASHGAFPCNVNHLHSPFKEDKRFNHNENSVVVTISSFSPRAHGWINHGDPQITKDGSTAFMYQGTWSAVHVWYLHQFQSHNIRPIFTGTGTEAARQWTGRRK